MVRAATRTDVFSAVAEPGAATREEADRMNGVTSKDGTRIAYDREGSGDPLILVGGAFVDRSENAPLASVLAAHFTTFNYDRRGRGQSGDVQPYTVEREIEDLEALIEVAGGRPHLYGVSSGGALVLEAAAAGVPATRLAVYEVPYNVADDAPEEQRTYVERLRELLAQDRRDEMAAYFMRTLGTPEEMIAKARSSPVWPGLEDLAHTLLYDAACMGDGAPPVKRLAAIEQPTLVAIGGASPDSFVGGGGNYFARAADVLAGCIPHASRTIVAEQTHMVEAQALAPVLVAFLNDPLTPHRPAR